MATAIATPAAIVCSSRRKDQIFTYSVSITRATFSFAFVPFHKSSSSVNLCSFLGNFRQISDEMLTSCSARGSQFLCPVFCEVDGRKEGDAKKQRVAYAIKVKSDESTNRHVLDIQNSVSSERKKMFKMERNPKRLNNSASQRNKIEYYQVIQYPLKTESTMGNILRHIILWFLLFTKMLTRRA